ncbi:MAG TPA: hypothetical protein VH593_04680 [Ktedonobacteraceae bacterium]
MFLAHFDGASLKSIAKLGTFSHEALGAEVVQEGAQLLVQAVPQVTSWQNGTGTLDNSFYVEPISFNSAAAVTEVIYARRRQWGFSGMTDSLGRFYPHDPASHFADKTIQLAQSQVQDLYARRINDAFVQAGS